MLASVFCLFALLWASPREVLWEDPGNVAALDFASGPGGPNGAPAPPFTFLKDDPSGSSPKLLVTDARNRQWSVKFGPEVKAEVFSSRVAWAAGYFVEPEYYIREGKVEKLGALGRAKSFFQPDGSFRDARFQLRDPHMKFLDGHSWGWDYNPFVGTPQLNGLKVVMMLVSNWDNKDARDQDEGTNTVQFEQTTSGNTRVVYAIVDWGASMGSWGNYFHRSNWRCDQFTAQSAQFIKSVRGDRIEWGYRGRHNDDFLRTIRVADVRWVMGTVGRVTDQQFRAGLLASGAITEEANCFTKALRDRIEQLRRVAK